MWRDLQQHLTHVGMAYAVWQISILSAANLLTPHEAPNFYYRISEQQGGYDVGLGGVRLEDLDSATWGQESRAIQTDKREQRLII